MKTNFPPYQGNRTVMAAVNAGEIPGGVIYHYYWFGDQANTGENSGDVTLHYFKDQDPGAFVSISAAVSCIEQERCGSAGVPALRHRRRRPDDPPDGRLVRVRDRQRRGSQPGARSARRPAGATIHPSSLDSKEVTDLMTEAGLL